MRKQVKIDRLIARDVTTKYGPKIKFSVQSNGEWATSWKAAWNAHWREGDTVDVFIEKGEYKGKPQFTFKNPEQTSGGGGEAYAKILQELQEIKLILREASIMPKNPKGELGGYDNEAPLPTDEDMPRGEQQEDIPF